MTLLVLRPEPGASRTVAAARTLGLDAVAAPLFAYRPIAWGLPDPLPQAVLLTSAAAARLGGPDLARLAHLPAYAVGAATAAAAREAGFGRVIAGDGDAAAIVARAEADGVAALLHLAGREHRAPESRCAIVRRIVYAAEPVAIEVDAAGHVALLHSPRAAAAFAALVADRATVAIAALSPAVAAAAGGGWRAVAIADRPTDTALLAAAAGLCDRADHDRGG